MSKRTKSRLFTIGFLVLVIGGYLIYKYAYLVYQSYDYYTSYDDVHGLQRSSPVMINGVRVGEVSDIEMIERGRVQVEFSIDKETLIPRGTTALLASHSLMGDKKIKLVLGEQEGYFTHNDFIPGKYDTTVLEMRDQIDPFVESAKYYLLSADKKFTKLKINFDHGLAVELQNDIYKLERNANNIHKKSYDISKNADRILSLVNRLNTQTASIASRNSQLNNSINSIEESSERLTQIEYSVKAEEVSKLANEIEEGAKKLQENAAMKKMLNDKSAYKNLNETVEKINESAKELNDDPPGISIF